MKKFKIIIITLVSLLAIIFLIGFYYNYQTSPISKRSEKVVVEIKEGTIASIGETLHEKGLIRSTLFFKLYVKINNINDLKASTYELDKNMKLSEILDVLKKGNAYNPDQITITFKEGLNIRKIAKLVEEETNNTYDSFMEIMNDNTYIDSLIDEYWFLTKDIKNTKIYYPLEGYLFPDTYEFLKDSKVEDIFKIMLDQMNNKLKDLKEEIDNSKYNIHELITLASIVELEGSSSNDRAKVAGVFYNRLDNNWTLGSDVTTYYAEKKDDWSGLTYAELNKCNAYNTRGNCVKGLPIGPICNPGIESIKAVINPEKTDNFYFVADCDGKTYLNKTESGHNSTISKLKRESKWCDN